MDLVFPSRAIPNLRGLRGDHWQSLVDQVNQLPALSPERLALLVVVARLSNCVTCSVDSYRAFNGCFECAQTALRRFRGSDDDLHDLFNQARLEVESYLDYNSAINVVSNMKG